MKTAGEAPSAPHADDDAGASGPSAMPYPDSIQGQMSGDGHDEQSLELGATFITGVAVDNEPVQSPLPSEDSSRRNIIAETLMTMDLPRINFMRKEIKKKKDGLDRVDFVITMGTDIELHDTLLRARCTVGDINDPVTCIEQLNMKTVADFCELFAQMDVNNDGTVDWEEMSSFMVDMGMRGWAESVVSLPTYSYAGQVDGAQPTLAADQIMYFSKNDTFAVIEPNASFFRVYQAESMQLRRQYNIKSAGGSTRALCYSKPTGHYIVATSASRVCFFEESSGIVWRSFNAPSNPICIAYAESHNLLAAGDTIGNLLSWSVDDIRDVTTDGDVPRHATFGGVFKTKRQMCQSSEETTLGTDCGHTDAILDILPLADTGVLASCGMDRTVKLWDLNTLGLKNTLLGHPKGVRHMAYCPDHRLIVSGGFCYDLVVSNPYVTSPINRLYGHSAPIVGVDHIAGTSQLITASADGSCRLWDLRTFSCVDTFTARAADTSMAKSKNKGSSCSYSAAKRESVLACMTVVPPYKRVLAGGRTVVRFEVVRDECADLTDDTAVLAVWFNVTNLTFVTASAWAVKIWDGDTGKLICADARQSPGSSGAKSELTSMCLGTRGRKVIVGDGKGRIKVFNHINHLELKDYKYAECTGQAHDSDVRALVFVEEHNLLISVSGDRSIAVHDESQRDNGALLRRITNASWSEITAIKYSAHFGLIATGSTDGSIQLWDFELARHEGCCMEKHPYAVTCLAFLDPFPILLSADLAGHIVLWALPPARMGLRFKRIFTWINKQPISGRLYGGGGGVDGMTPVPVTALECQVEMIETSVASIVTSSAVSSVGHDGGEAGDDEESVGLSLDPDDNADAASETSPDGEGSVKAGVEDGKGTTAAADGGSVGQEKKASGEAAAPREGGKDERGGERGDGGNKLPPGGSVSGFGGSAASPDPSAGESSRDRSFQARLAATFRKYQGARHRYGSTYGQARGGGASSSQHLQAHWNTEMLAYVVYAADDIGRVTTWDLKPVILSLVHTHGGHEWGGHGVGVVSSPAVYSNVFQNMRYDAKDVLHQQRCRLHARAAAEWTADPDSLGLHRIESWEAHGEPILCLNLVDDPPTVLTASMDRLVKLWSPAGDLLGVLRPIQDPESPWIFRANRKAHQERRSRAAEEVLRTRRRHRTSFITSNTRNKEKKDPRIIPPVNAPPGVVGCNGSSSSGSECGGDDDDSVGNVVDGAYSKHVLDGATTKKSPMFEHENQTSRTVAVPRLKMSGISRTSEPGGAAWGIRKTPRRVPVRPNTSRGSVVNRGVRGGVSEAEEGAKVSPRTNQGRLVSRRSLSAR